jgi:hypothetical protein
MYDRKQLWDRAEELITRINQIKNPMQNECNFSEEEIKEFLEGSYTLCTELMILASDIYNYMGENKLT